MAVIRAFRHEVKGYGTRHATDVDCLYFDFLDVNGEQILQLSTLGSDQRQSQPKVSQTFQIGREGAAELRSILEQTFAGIAGQQPEHVIHNGPPAMIEQVVESADPIERFAARASLVGLEEVDSGTSKAHRRAIAHDDRPLVGCVWYLVDFSHLEPLTYRDVKSDLRSAPTGYQRMAVLARGMSDDLQAHLRDLGADVVFLTDLGLASPLPPPSFPPVSPPPPLPARISYRDAFREGAVGPAQRTLPDLQYMCATLGVMLSTPDDAWPGHGRAVNLHGGGTAYLNRTNIEVRATPSQVAAWARAGLGTVRGPQGQYLRMALGGASSAGAQLRDGGASVAASPPPRTPATSPAPPASSPAPKVRLAASFPWLEQLFETGLYAEQKALAGRAATSDDVVRDVLTALIQLGSSGPIETVEHEAGLSTGELRRLVPLLRRLLNIDGYEAIAFADGILELDDELLRQQFELTRAHRLEGESR